MNAMQWMIMVGMTVTILMVFWILFQRSPPPPPSSSLSKQPQPQPPSTQPPPVPPRQLMMGTTVNGIPVSVDITQLVAHLQSMPSPPRIQLQIYVHLPNGGMNEGTLVLNRAYLEQTGVKAVVGRYDYAYNRSEHIVNFGSFALDLGEARTAMRTLGVTGEFRVSIDDAPNRVFSI